MCFYPSCYHLKDFRHHRTRPSEPPNIEGIGWCVRCVNCGPHCIKGAAIKVPATPQWFKIKPTKWVVSFSRLSSGSVCAYKRPIFLGFSFRGPCVLLGLLTAHRLSLIDWLKCVSLLRYQQIWATWAIRHLWECCSEFKILFFNLYIININ